MSKDYSNSAIVKDYIAKSQANGRTVEDTIIGNNGYALGQEFHTTGVVKVKERDINGKNTVYVVVETTEGVELSIKSLMNISSLQGYETSGTFQSESLEGSKTVTKDLTAKVVDGFDFADVYQPTTRGLLSFIAEAEESNLFANKVVRYLGTVVRPYEAKKDSPSTSFEKYKAGMKRAMSQKLWEIR